MSLCFFSQTRVCLSAFGSMMFFGHCGLSTLDGATKVTAIVEGDASGFFKLAEPLLARMVKRSIDADYARLKGLLESESW